MPKTNTMRLLDQRGEAYEVVEYDYDPDDLSVERIVEDNQLSLEAIYKTLVLQGTPSGIVVALVPGDRLLDRKALAKISGKKSVAMLPAEELLGRTGYIRGGCSPLGMKRAYPVYVDESVGQRQTVYINAGVRGVLLGVAPDALVECVEATVAPITRVQD